MSEFLGYYQRKLFFILFGVIIPLMSLPICPIMVPTAPYSLKSITAYNTDVVNFGRFLCSY